MSIDITFEWEGRAIRLSYHPRYLDMFDHIEIRSVDGGPLPITETGYKSHFFGPVDPLLSNDEVVEMITRWLEKEAGSISWQNYLQQSKQLSLF